VLKNILKNVLIKLGLLEKIKSKYRKLSSKNIFNEEFSINTGMLKGAAAIEESLRIKVHAIEKMLVIENLSALNNNVLLTDMVSKLDVLLELGYNGENNIIIESLSIINCFIELCKKHSVNYTGIENKVASLIVKHKLSKKLEDYKDVKIITEAKSPKDMFIDDYKYFIKTRVSIRKTKQGLVEKNIVRGIIDLANQCPSACNRQPCKVYYSVNADMQSKLKTLCGDQKVSKNLSNFMVPTVDKMVFSPYEYFQAWLNGGIFIDSLINAIHAYGLGACLFKTIKTYSNVPKIKSLLEIPMNEDILCIVGFGEYCDNFNYIEKHRKPTNSIAIEK
jgi:nitroreductase